MVRYGVVGVGSLGAAVTEGLGAAGHRVLLSPRNAGRAAGLAARWPGVEVAESNQAVLDSSDAVLVCLRQLDAALLGDLVWRPDHVVVSVVAGTSISALSTWTGPATVARAVPMPEVATRSSRTPAYPPLPPVVQLFDQLGGTVPLTDEDQFDAVFTALGTVAPLLSYLDAIAAFLTRHGVAPGLASRIVGDSFAGVGTTLGREEAPDFAALTRLYAPPGGGNAQLLESLAGAGWVETVGRSLEEVHQRLTGPDR